MALVGLIDPSHTEDRKRQKPGRLPAWLPTADTLAALEGNPPKWAPWTWELADAMLSEYQDRGDRITVSALVSSCPRSEVIKRKEDYVADFRDLYIPFRGTMVHRTLEYHRNPAAIAEARFYTTVDDVEFSCSPDLLTARVLYDYKVTETPPAYNYPYTNHKEQVEFNAFVTRHAEKWDLPKGVTSLPFDPRENPVEHVAVVYLGPKYVKVLEVEHTVEVFTMKGTFKKQAQPFVWPDPYVLKVLRPRLHIFKAALESYPAWPEPWIDPKDDKEYSAEQVWGGEMDWDCPGPPLCYLPDCLAKRWPNRLMWDQKGVGLDDPKEDEAKAEAEGR